MKEVNASPEFIEAVYGADPATFKDVECVSINEVFTPEEVASIRSKAHLFEIHQCASNSAHFCLCAPKQGYVVSFCEGVYWGCVKHCWNKVVRLRDNKTFYIDITAELVLHENLNDRKQYQLYAEWTTKEITSLFDKYHYAFTPFDGQDIGKKYVKVDKRTNTIYEYCKDKVFTKQLKTY